MLNSKIKNNYLKVLIFLKEKDTDPSTVSLIFKTSVENSHKNNSAKTSFI